MARIRTPLPWGRKPAVPQDASFFEGASAWRPRPDSPEVSVFSPEEEAESHARWRRAVLRERFTGPVSNAEKLGFGLSAAALAALASFDEQSGDEEETASPANDTGVAPVADTTTTTRKPVATGDAEKPAIITKPVGTTHAFLDGGVENVFISPASTRVDNGVTVRRAAPRGSGAPLEARPLTGAERADAGAGRKAEAAPTEARTASLTDGAFAARGPAEASAAAAMAIAMEFYVPDARAEEGQVQAKTAAVAAKAEGGRAPAEARSEAAADVPPAALRVDAEQDRLAVAEASCPEPVDNAPAATEGKATDGGRGGGAAEAVARPKAKDAAPTAAAVDTEARGGEEAAEAPVEAKAKDVAPVAESVSSLGNKTAIAPARTEAVEIAPVEAKSLGRDRGAPEAQAQQTKAKDATAVHEAKAETLRDPSAGPEQAMGRDAWTAGDVSGTASGRNGATSIQAKATDAAASGKVGDGQIKTEAPVQQVKAVDAVGAAVTAGNVDRADQITDAALQQAKGVVGKAEPVQGSVVQPGQAKDIAAAVGTLADGTRDPVVGTGQAKDAPGAAGTKVDAGLGDVAKALTGQGKAKDAPTVEIGSGTARDVKDASALADTRAGNVQTVEQAKDAAGVAATKADGALGVAASAPSGLGKATDALAVVSKPEPEGAPEAAKGASTPGKTDLTQTAGQTKDAAATKAVEGSGDAKAADGALGGTASTPAGLGKATDVLAVGGKPGVEDVPGGAKDASTPAKTDLAQTAGQTKDIAASKAVEGTGDAKAVDGALGGIANTLAGFGKATDVLAGGSKAGMEDVPGGAKDAPTPAKTDLPQTVGQAKDAPDTTGDKAVANAGDLAKALGGIGMAKDTPAVAVQTDTDVALGAKDAPVQTKGVPIVAKPEADGPQPLADPAGPAKENAVPIADPPKADRGSIEPAGAGKGGAQAADLVEQAQGVAQPSAAPAQDSTTSGKSGALAAPPVVDTLAIDVSDMWPGGKNSGGQGETIVLSTAGIEPVVSQVIDLTVANGGQDKAAPVSPAGTDTSPDGAAAPLPAPPAADNKGVPAAAPDQPATKAAPGEANGPAAPVGKAGATDPALPAQQTSPPAVTKVESEQTEAAKPSVPPADPAGGVAPLGLVTNEQANGDALALGDVLNLFAPMQTDNAPAGHSKAPAGSGPASVFGPDAGPSVLEIAPPHGVQDLVLL